MRSRRQNEWHTLCRADATLLLPNAPQLPWSHTSVRRRRNSFSQLSLTPAPRALSLTQLEARLAQSTRNGIYGSRSDRRSSRKYSPEPRFCGANTEDDHNDYNDGEDQESPSTLLLPWNAEPHVQKGSKAGRLRRQHSWCICYCKKSPGQAEAHGSASCSIAALFPRQQ
jgi:hypothetical protein